MEVNSWTKWDTARSGESWSRIPRRDDGAHPREATVRLEQDPRDSWVLLRR